MFTQNWTYKLLLLHCDDLRLLFEGGSGQQDIPVSAEKAAAEGLSGLHGTHLGPPGDGLCALQLLAVEEQQVDEAMD